MPQSVLVVEDERIVAKDLQQTLASMGYDAFAVASSSTEAIARASERCPDIVLMDIRIKGSVDGIETAAILRERFNVPVIYLTAHADEGTLQRAKVTEPYGYLMKPVTAAALRSAIEVSLFRHSVTRKLQERERWFSMTLRSIADAVITVDLDGKVTFMNRAAETLVGIESSAALGRPVREIVRLTDPNHPASPLDHVLAERKVYTVDEAPIAHSAGDRLISDSAAPVEEGGEMLGAVMVFRDVTEKRLLQQQVELAERLAALGTMAAGVSHEINNLLASVVANAGFALDELQSLRRGGAVDVQRIDAAIESQTDLLASAESIARIVTSLRNFSRPIGPSPIGQADLRHVVEWAIRATAHEFRSRATVVSNLGPTPRVKIDETRLGQVLVNLLVNAAHSIAPGRLESNLVRIDARAEANTAVIEIRDTGCGMSPETLKRIFEPFFTTRDPGTGTGLGLAICRGIVASVGGTVEVESEPGAGTLFRIVLPIATEAAAPVAAAATGNKRGRILVIDDEPMVLRATERLLRAHDVTCVNDARNALARLAAAETFDVIVTDMLMPHMTGRQFYERLLGEYPEMARRVIFLTGGSSGAEDESFLDVVANTSLCKPVFGADLDALVQRMLAQDASS